MRADARRNYERLLSEARTVITEQGTDASLEEVARRAGVGIGTLYRHFPTREDLLEALLRARFDAVTAEGGELLRSASPRRAVEKWLLTVATQAGAYRGVVAAMMNALNDEGSRLHASCMAMRDSGMALLRRAQESGEVRHDVNPGDVMVLAHGIAWAAEQLPGDPDLAPRLLEVMMDGLRPRAS